MLNLANGALDQGMEITRIILGLSRGLAELSAAMLLHLDRASALSGEESDTEQVFKDMLDTYETMTRLAYTRMSSESEQ